MIQNEFLFMVNPVVVCDARAPTLRLCLTQLLDLTTAQFELEARVEPVCW